LLQTSHRSLSDTMKAAVALQDAFLFSFLWYTGMRVSDALNCIVADFQPLSQISASGGAASSAPLSWNLSLGLSKTRVLPSQGYDLVITDDQSGFHPITLWSLLLSTLDQLDLSLDVGPVFRSISLSDDGDYQWGKPLGFQYICSRLSSWLAPLVVGNALIANIRPHSFHGSHAAHRLSLGHIQSVIIFEMDWSQEYFNYYLSQPVLTLLGSVASPLAVSGRFGR